MHQNHHKLLSSSLGCQREITSYHFNGTTDQHIYIQASLHADELPGMVVAWYLKHQLAALETGGALRASVTLVPVANPIGLGQYSHGSHLGRFDMISGQDFNRQYPVFGPQIIHELEDKLGNDEHENKRLIRQTLYRHLADVAPETELESQRLILMQLAASADIMLDLHCDWEAVAHLYTVPQGWPVVEPLARYLGSETQLLAEISGGEPFDEACYEVWATLRRHFADRFPVPLGLIPVTVELRGVREVSDEQAQADATAIIHFLTQAGYIAGKAPDLPPLRYPATPLAGCEYISAPQSGVILHHRQVGDWIRKGDIIADILDPLSDKRTPLKATTDGVLYARHWMRFAARGMLVARIAGTEIIRNGDLLVP